MVSRRVFCRLGTCPDGAVRSRARSSRVSSAFGVSSLLRAAASSIANGSPSSRVQTATTSATLSGVSAKVAFVARACWVNSCTAPDASACCRVLPAGSSSGGTAC